MQDTNDYTFERYKTQLDQVRNHPLFELGLAETAEGKSGESPVVLTLSDTEIARAVIALTMLAIDGMDQIAKVSGDYRGGIEALETAEAMLAQLAAYREAEAETHNESVTEG